MRILAFDTAGNGCSVCLWQDGQTLALRTLPMSHGQAEQLIPMIAAVREDSGLDWRDLDAIAVTIGPGSFTGLRVGLAAAQGLTLATGLPVIGITTLESYARQAADAGYRGAILVAVDARRDDLYLQPFHADDTGGLRPLAAPLAAPVEQVPSLLTDWGITTATVTGDATALLGGIAALTASHPQAAVDPACLAGLAAGRSAAEAPAIPLYIRPPDAAIPQNGGQLRPDVPHD